MCHVLPVLVSVDRLDQQDADIDNRADDCRQTQSKTRPIPTDSRLRGTGLAFVKDAFQFLGTQENPAVRRGAAPGPPAPERLGVSVVNL
jgi:hypothetical protein